MLALSVRYFQNSEVGTFGLLLIVSAMPAFIFGLTEDLTKKVGVHIRLLATVASAGLAGYFLNAWLSSVQILGVDNLMLLSRLRIQPEVVALKDPEGNEMTDSHSESST